MQEKLGVVIVGFGYIAEFGHLPAWRNCPATEVIAVVDPNMARRKRAGEIIADVGVFSSLDECLNSLTNNLQIVDICAPHLFHFKLAQSAIRAGKHVFCEKPLTQSTDEVWQLVKAAAQNHCILYPCQNYDFAPSITRARALIRKGTIGEITVGNIRIDRVGHALGTPHWRPDWRREPENAGLGILADHGPHAMAISQGILGTQPIHCAVSIWQHSANKSQNEDSAAVILSSLTSSVTLLLTWAAPKRRSYFEFAGTKGRLVLDGDQLRIFSTNGELKLFENVPSNFGDTSHQDWFGLVFAEFLENVADSRQPKDLLENAYTFAWVAETAVRNSASTVPRDGIGMKGLFD